MAVMAIDLGTTHCKVAIVAPHGGEHLHVSAPTKLEKTPEGLVYYEPEGLWQTLLGLMKQACTALDLPIDLICVAGMAEAGLYVDTRSMLPVTHIIPWFDMRTVCTYSRMQPDIDDYERFTRTGLRNHFKYGVYKMQWLLENSNLDPTHLMWLSVPDYIAFCLTGEFATDFSLAARTYLFDIFEKRWVDEYRVLSGIQGIHLPDVFDSGSEMGRVKSSVMQMKGLECFSSNTSVSIAGHDHLCGSLAVGAISSGIIYDSMGTAETLMGTLEIEKLGVLEYESGFSFGRSIVGDNFYWLGSAAASGGSVEWAKQLFCTEPYSYEELMATLDTLGSEPTGIIYLPYLSGSNFPYSDPAMAGAYLGLRKSHGKADLLKAVLEGVSFEMEWIRKRAYDFFKHTAQSIRCVGGGTRNHHWMQIKANVFGMPMENLKVQEATLLGAAWIGMVKTQKIFSVLEIIDLSHRFSIHTYEPDQIIHEHYQRIFNTRYLPIQQSLRNIMGSPQSEDTHRTHHHNEEY